MREPDPSCVFCRIVAGELPSTKVHEDDEFVAFRDIEPAAPVHVVIVPRVHIATVDHLAEGDAELVGRMLLVAQRVARAEGVVEPGYRIVVNVNPGAGQTVFHLHMHVLGGRNLGALG